MTLEEALNNLQPPPGHNTILSKEAIDLVCNAVRANQPASVDIDAAAKLIAEWIGYSWDGLSRRRGAEFPQWSFDGLGHKHFQGTQDDLRALVQQVILAAPLPAPAMAKRWRHVKRGSTYVEVGRGELQRHNPGIRSREALEDGSIMVAYRCEQDGRLWVRSASEFDDGRFEPLPYAPAPAVAQDGVTEEMVAAALDACPMFSVNEIKRRGGHVSLDTDQIRPMLEAAIAPLLAENVSLKEEAAGASFEYSRAEAAEADANRLAEALKWALRNLTQFAVNELQTSNQHILRALAEHDKGGAK